MNLTYLKDVCDIKKCAVFCIGYDHYLLMSNDESVDDLHEIHSNCEFYPTENYIYDDPSEIIPIFFNMDDIYYQMEFKTWEEMEDYFPIMMDAWRN